MKDISAAYQNKIPVASKREKENFPEIKSQMSLFIILDLTYL